MATYQNCRKFTEKLNTLLETLGVGWRYTVKWSEPKSDGSGWREFEQTFPLNEYGIALMTYTEYYWKDEDNISPVITALKYNPNAC